MFKKWGEEKESVDKDSIFEIENIEKEFAKDDSYKNIDKKNSNGKNTILKGCKLTGDIKIDCDLELNGEVHGNIISEKKSNIVIKGICKGNIETKEGSVEIKGEMQKGNITAGRNVTISGKYKGGEIKAKGKILIHSDFNGKLEGNEIEIGPKARVKGELIFKDTISITKGAEVEGLISKTQEELSMIKSAHEKNAVKIKPFVKKLSEVK